MESGFKVSERLAEYARSSNSFSSKVKALPDYEQEYREVFSQFGLSETEIEEKLVDWEMSKIRSGLFFKNNPQYQIIFDIMEAIHNELIVDDTRNQDLISYDIEVVIFVSLLAGLCGCTNDEEIASFWFDNNMTLQHIIPGMPSPKHMISSETVRTIRKLVSEEVFHEFFVRHFGKIKVIASEMIRNKEYDVESYRHLIGGDGQELKASFRPGSFNRKEKGGHGITIFDCDDESVLGFTVAEKKNHEAESFIDILNRITVAEDVIFYADALNLKQVLINYLNQRKLDWLFPVKNNGGNKELKEGISQAFNEVTDRNITFKHETVEKSSGRLETTSFFMMSAESLPEELRNRYGRTGTIIKVEKETCQVRSKVPLKEQKTPRKTGSVRYYISSLEPTEENFRQLVHSIGVRWYYETHHNTIDCVMLQDHQALCNKANINSTVGKNKILYNLISYARQRLSHDGFRRTRFRSEKSKASKPLSYQITCMTLSNNIYLAFRVMVDYLLDEFE